MGEEKKKTVFLYLIKGSSIRNLETGSLQEEGANRTGRFGYCFSKNIKLETTAPEPC